jgi:hypothetical protein
LTYKGKTSILLSAKREGLSIQLDRKDPHNPGEPLTIRKPTQRRIGYG